MLLKQLSRLHGRTFFAFAALSTAIFANTANAQVTLNSNVVFNIGTGVYTYSYSVMNNGPLFDLAIVTLPVAPNSNLMNLTAPAGFGISFDPGLGLVSFFEDADFFTPQTFSPSSSVGLFSFMTTVASATVEFTALDVLGTEFTGTALAPIPEPVTLFWALLFLRPLCFPAHAAILFPIQSSESSNHLNL